MEMENQTAIQKEHIEYYDKLRSAAKDFDLMKLATLCRALAERKEVAKMILDSGDINRDQTKQIFHYHNENIKKILGL